MALVKKHPIVHVELSAKDREKLASFYEDLCGWTPKHFPEMNYSTFNTGVEGPGGGYNPVNDENPAGTVLVYIGSEDIDADLKTVEKLGGKVLVPRSPIPGTGWYAIFEDPSGNKMGFLSGNESARE